MLKVRAGAAREAELLPSPIQVDYRRLSAKPVFSVESSMQWKQAAQRTSYVYFVYV